MNACKYCNTITTGNECPEYLRQFKMQRRLLAYRAELKAKPQPVLSAFLRSLKPLSEPVP